MWILLMIWLISDRQKIFKNFEWLKESSHAGPFGGVQGPSGFFGVLRILWNPLKSLKIPWGPSRSIEGLRDAPAKHFHLASKSGPSCIQPGGSCQLRSRVSERQQWNCGIFVLLTFWWQPLLQGTCAEYWIIFGFAVDQLSRFVLRGKQHFPNLVLSVNRHLLYCIFC